MSMYPSTAAEVSEPRTQIASELDALTSEIGYTEKIAAELSDRLAVVTSPRQADENAAQPTPEPVRTPLGSTLHEQRVKLERVNERLRRLMSSLELPFSRELNAETPALSIGTGTHG